MNGHGSRPGEGTATASFVCGLIGVIYWFFGYTLILSVILGIVGLILASRSKQEGFDGGMRTAGFVLSLVSLVLGGIILIACVACVGTLGMLGTM